MRSTPRKTTNITHYFFGILSIDFLELFDRKTMLVICHYRNAGLQALSSPSIFLDITT